nr:PREDICTED: anoctamin-7-like [Stegastes partitus]
MWRTRKQSADSAMLIAMETNAEDSWDRVTTNAPVQPPDRSVFSDGSTGVVAAVNDVSSQCGAGGCLIDLAQELLVIMVGKQLINNIQEFFLLKLKSWWQRRKLNRQTKKEDEEEAQRDQQQYEEVPQWEADYQLQVCGGLFDEYLETVLQFGFITIFVAACPLAPLFALINNWVEIRLDAHKFVTEYRRPVVERAQDIGIWFPILQFITHMAVLSNAFLIAFTSSFLPRLYYRYTRDSTLSGFIDFTLATSPHVFSQRHHNASCRYRGFRDENGEYLPEYFHLLAIRLGFIIVFEHVVFFIGRLIDLMVPDIPEEVEMKIKREHYMAKEALAENQFLRETLILGDKDVPSGDLQQNGSRTSPPQSDSPPPNLTGIPEETIHQAAAQVKWTPAASTSKVVLQEKKKICFVLLSAPWSVLCYYAEEISLRVPLQVVEAPNLNWSEVVLSKLSLPNPLSQDVPNPPADFYTCQFRTNKLQRFLGSDHKETFFKTTQRHQVLYEILARTPYGSVKKGEVGIDRLAGLLFDNGGTVFLSVFMSLWAVTFLEYWKRTCSTLSHRWDCSDFEDIEERPRPEFTAMAPMTVRNPVTGAEEPYFPEMKRVNRTLTGCMVIIIMVAVVLMFVIGVIMYRTIITVLLYRNTIISTASVRMKPAEPMEGGGLCSELTVVSSLTEQQVAAAPLKLLSVQRKAAAES